MELPTPDEKRNEDLLMAIRNGNFVRVRNLIRKGADIEYDNGRPLALASFYGNYFIAKYLVENGANIHLNDDAALRLASEMNHMDVVRYLVRMRMKIIHYGQIL